MKAITALLTLATAFTFALSPGNTAFAADDDTPLTKEMNGVNKDLRKLKKQVADASKKDENIGLVDDIKKHLVTGRDMEPATTKDQPADKKAAFIAKYKEQIDSTIKDFDALSAAIKADKADEAKTLLEKLQKDKEQGHKDFRPDDK